MKFRNLTLSAISLGLLSPLNAQEKQKVEKKNVFIKNGDKKEQVEKTEPNVGILIEYISVDHVTANRIIGEISANPNNVEKTRDSLEEMIDAGKADLVETVWVRARSGDRAKTESIIEHIYPTEYDPPEIPNLLGNVSSNSPDDENSSRIHITHGMPSAFEIRNVGTTLEVDPVLSDDFSSINLNLAPEIVVFKGNQDFTREGFEDTAKGIDNMMMPLFHTIKDTTQMVVVPGKYNLLGIHTPHDDKTKRILVLLRADLISF